MLLLKIRIKNRKVKEVIIKKGKTEEEKPQEEKRYEDKKEISHPETVSILKRLEEQLSKTRNALSAGIERVFKGKNGLDDDTLEELEELLITSDVGVKTSTELIQRIVKKSGSISDVSKLKTALKEEIFSFFPASSPIDYNNIKNKPHVIMIIGVNGVGKTTTIGKIAAKFKDIGKKTLIGACDTFRAAAAEQLTIWSERAGAEIVRHKENSDPAAVAFDSIDAAIARGIDIVMIDTAGRLHTRVNLMEELKKIKRSISNKLQGAPHEILLVLDATTGQNALSQAKMFHEALGITGIIVTKLDGTAKGGVVAAICHTLNIPLKYIGIGEKIEDLQDFDAKQFVDALF
ncbi:MAG: signal recognition particle-docking protein FtsY [Desulfobacterales bacterium]|nr:signal recognition particle-docking protein FtsY [Desulfobacterales bacterium]